jgi:hypothetical protein
MRSQNECMIAKFKEGVVRALRLLCKQEMKSGNMHEMMGYSFPMVDISVAMGISRFRTLAGFNNKSLTNAKFLSENLADLVFAIVQKHIKHGYYQYIISIQGTNKDLFVAQLKKYRVKYRACYSIPVRKLSSFVINNGRHSSICANKVATTELAAKQVIALLVHPKFPMKNLEHIEAILRNVQIMLLNIRNFRRFNLPNRFYVTTVSEFVNKISEYQYALNNSIVPLLHRIQISQNRSARAVVNVRQRVLEQLGASK